MIDSLTRFNASYSRPILSSFPGMKFSTLDFALAAIDQSRSMRSFDAKIHLPQATYTTSALAASLRMISLPFSVFMSTAIDRLFRLMELKYSEVCFASGFHSTSSPSSLHSRVSSWDEVNRYLGSRMIPKRRTPPCGCSTLITFAP